MIDLLGLEGDAKDCYTKAIQYCSELIDGNKVGNYSLVRDPERLCKLFSDINQENPEAIFEFTLDMQKEYVSSPYLFASSYLNLDKKNQNAKVAYTTIDKLYEQQDKRDTSFLTPEVNMWGELTGYATLNKWREGVWKQSDPNNPYSKEIVAVSTNFAYWRLSGIYLLRAECNAKLNNQSGEAIRDLNEIVELQMRHFTRMDRGMIWDCNMPSSKNDKESCISKGIAGTIWCGMGCGILITSRTKVLAEN